MALKARKVIKCDKNGKDLQGFSSAKEAALSFGSDCPSAISKAICHGNCAFGYRWRYENEPLFVKPTGTPGKKRGVVAIRETDKKETLFPSISSASRELSIGVTAIESALLMGCLAKGYRFRYEGEELASTYKNKKKRLEVVAIDDSGKEIMTYPCAYDAAKAIGVSVGAIYRCLNERNPDAKCQGYRFRYKKS